MFAILARRVLSGPQYMSGFSSLIAPLILFVRTMWTADIVSECLTAISFQFVYLGKVGHSWYNNAGTWRLEGQMP